MKQVDRSTQLEKNFQTSRRCFAL